MDAFASARLSVRVFDLYRLISSRLCISWYLCNCWCEFSVCEWATHVWHVPQHDREKRNVTSIGVQSALLGLLGLLISIQKYKTVHVLGQQTW